MTTSTVSNRAVAAAGPAASDAARTPRRARQSSGAGYAFMAPFLVLFVVFLVWPVVHGVYLSFTDQSLTGNGGALIGFSNYAEAFADGQMWGALANTLWFTVLSTVPLVVVALVMALLVQMGLPAQWLWRLSFFMPFLLASAVVSIIWAWMYNPSLGVINAGLETLGIKVFDQIYIMLNQAITPSTRSAVVYIFETGFTGYRFGYSSAISYIFFALIVIISLVQLRATSRKSL